MIYASPTTLRVPTIGYDNPSFGSYVINTSAPIYVEHSANMLLSERLYFFNTNLGWIHARNLSPGLQTVDANDNRLDTFEPDAIAVNQQMSFGKVIYYTVKYGWVYMPNAPYPGYVPIEVQRRLDDSDDQPGEGNPPTPDTVEWYGDAFYSAGINGSFPNVSNVVQWEARGTLKNNTNPEPARLKMWFPRWQKTDTSTMYGDDYLPIDEPRPYPNRNRYVGSPRWQDQNGKYYVRSLKTSNGYYTYGDIHRSYKAGASNAWIIGTRDSGDWWEGPEPDRNSAVTFTYMGEGENVDDLTITFTDYVAGNNAELVRLSEVAKWT